LRSTIVVSPDPAGPALCDDRGVPTRVLIVDDHPSFRSVARAVLEKAGFQVVGESFDLASALAAVRSTGPAVVLLDIQLADADGFAVAECLAGEPDPPAIVFVSSRDGASYRQRIAASPALGFIPKSELSGAALAALVG
jgi:DNA-binding NarL/FixJ family response regulator